MPWFDRIPSIEDYEFWKWERLNGTRLVGKWPHPNTPRVDCRFRIKHTSPTLIPLASRWGIVYYQRTLDYDPSFSDRNGIGWFDFETRGDNKIGVTTPADQNGFTVEVEVCSKDELDALLGPGVEMEVTVDHPSFGRIKQVGEWLNHPDAVNWLYNMNTNFWHGSGRWSVYEVDPGWPFDLEIDIWAVNECYPFVQTPVGMAAFNGSDAYIKLDNLMSFANNPFRLSCEVRLNQTANHWPILGRDGTGGFFGMEDDDIVFGNLQLDTSWTPVQDEWVTWVYEFEPSTQLQHKLSIAGTVVKDATHSRQSTPFNTIGVYKQGVSGTLWADMDLRNLKIEAGTPGSYTTLLDMPLLENALDAGPEENHGTTFNMELPSV